MKKFVFLLVLAFAFTAGLFAQMNPDIAGAKRIIQERQTKIWNIIQMSKEVNQRENGINNPDLILPGKPLTFKFEDGTEYVFTVEKGESQWKILSQNLETMEKDHGSVVPYSSQTVLPARHRSPSGHEDSASKKDSPIAFKVPEPIVFHWYQDERWIWGIIIAIAVLSILAKLLQMRHKARNADPVTAGPPQVKGGVKDAGAHERMQQIVQSRFPGARMNIRNIRRGRLSGLAKVFYANGKAKKIRLKNAPAYAGDIVVNNQTETIYFLQGCGNDARAGNYMTGKDLIFTPDAMINSDGTEVPVPDPTTLATQPATPVQDPGTEFHQHVSKALETVKGFLDSNTDKHRVNIKITPDNFEVTVENRFDQKNPRSPKKEGESEAK